MPDSFYEWSALFSKHVHWARLYRCPMFEIPAVCCPCQVAIAGVVPRDNGDMHPQGIQYFRKPGAPGPRGACQSPSPPGDITGVFHLDHFTIPTSHLTMQTLLDASLSTVVHESVLHLQRHDCREGCILGVLLVHH